MSLSNTNYAIRQDFRYEGENWWDWSVWIEATEEMLDRIDYVVYTLHPTFAKPVVKVRDRRSRFKLETEGWGTFRIYARLFLKDRREVALEHDLRLEYPDGTEYDD